MRFALLAVCFMCSAGCSNTNTHVREDGGVNPLVSDVISGNVEAVSRRIETGEGKLSDRSFGARMTLLSVAASQGRTSVVQYLLNRGLSPNIPDQGGMTALAYAVLADSPACVEILLNAGANPNAMNIHGSTPLCACAVIGNQEIAEILIRHGADRSLRNLKGETAADVARDEGNESLAAFLAPG